MSDPTVKNNSHTSSVPQNQAVNSPIPPENKDSATAVSSTNKPHQTDKVETSTDPLQAMFLKHKSAAQEEQEGSATSQLQQGTQAQQLQQQIASQRQQSEASRKV